MKLLIILGLVGVGLSASVPTLDFSNWIATEGVAAYSRNTRIINGQVVIPNSRPFQAGVLTRLPSGLTGLCGGSLLTAERVLTAAHCWFDGINQGESVQVVLGAHELFGGGLEDRAQAFESVVVVVHPQYLPQLARRDIAIVYLPQAAILNDYVSTIALPLNFPDETFVNQVASISGWGVIENGQGISQELRLVNTPIISNAICRIPFPILLQDDNICTSGLGVVGACNGDSGGPVTVETDDGTIIVGLVSFGSPLGCEASLPSVHARVTSFLDFITSNLN